MVPKGVLLYTIQLCEALGMAWETSMMISRANLQSSSFASLPSSDEDENYPLCYHVQQEPEQADVGL